MSTMPQGDQWKDPRYVEEWRRSRRGDLEKKWRTKFSPLLVGVPLAASPRPLELGENAHELIQWENEALTDRAHRLEGGKKKNRVTSDQARHQVPAMIAFDNGWILHPAIARATPAKLEKAQRMYEAGLEKKAQREIACGLLGGEVHCRSGHVFRVAYECGNRYCSICAPRDGKKLFARQADRLRFVATRLMMCGADECSECSAAIDEKRVPHWPPERGAKPRIVCAKIDFTLKHDRDSGLPNPERMRALNLMIKKFCRALEKRFRISRKEYGLAYCDELGGNNSNPHAHGIYVGPWLPQERKQLSNLWREITGDSFILSIKYARNFTEALFHAIKYPAKFAERSSPARLADLESVFHRVRRFHTLAAFYAPEAPPSEKPPLRKCPCCGDQLSDPRGWQTIAELARRGLQDLTGVIQQMARERGMGDLAPP